MEQCNGGLIHGLHLYARRSGKAHPEVAPQKFFRKGCRLFPSATEQFILNNDVRDAVPRLGLLDFICHMGGGPGAPLSPPHFGRGAEPAVVNAAARSGQHHEPSLHGRVLHAQAPVILQGQQMQGRKAETVQVFLKRRGRHGKTRSGQSRNGPRIPFAIAKAARKSFEGVFPFADTGIVEAAFDKPLRHHTCVVAACDKHNVRIPLPDGAGQPQYKSMGHAGVHPDADQGRVLESFHDFRFRKAKAAELIVNMEQAPRRQAKTVEDGDGDPLFLKISRKVQQARGHERNTAVGVAGQMHEGGID